MGVVKEKFAKKTKLHRLFFAHRPIRSAGLKTIKNPVSGAGFSLEFAGLIKSAHRRAQESLVEGIRADGLILTYSFSVRAEPFDTLERTLSKHLLKATVRAEPFGKLRRALSKHIKNVIPEAILIGNPVPNRPKSWIPDTDIRG